ncbi:MAG: prepilin-type N-terminal cleavage/methylation domain-containing protein [Brevinematia bacterium]
MLKKSTQTLGNNKGFSLIETLVAIFIASLTILSVVESYRYILSVTYGTKEITVMLNAVKRVYNDTLLGKISFETNFYTNVDGVEIHLILTNTTSTNPLISDVLIFATNANKTFSVLTSIY